MATHVNAFKQDVRDAFAEAKKVLGEVEAKYEALLAKLEADEAPEAPVQAQVPVVNAEKVSEPARDDQGHFVKK